MIIYYPNGYLLPINFFNIKGDIQKLGLSTFLCTPENVDVTGTISNASFEEVEFEKGW